VVDAPVKGSLVKLGTDGRLVGESLPSLAALKQASLAIYTKDGNDWRVTTISLS